MRHLGAAPDLVIVDLASSADELARAFMGEIRLPRSLSEVPVSLLRIRSCAEFDAVVGRLLRRPLDGGPYRYFQLDALTQHVRQDGRVVQVVTFLASLPRRTSPQQTARPRSMLRWAG